MDTMIPAVAINRTGSEVLCIVDFSDASRNALQAAITIAEATKSRVTALYPYRLNQPRNVPDVSKWKKSLEEDAVNSFNRMTGSLLKESGISWQFRPEVGFVDDRIEAFAIKNNVGIIVISGELASKSDGALMDVLEKITTPLLVVPNKRKSE
jgi:hypothetical protein